MDFVPGSPHPLLIHELDVVTEMALTPRNEDKCRNISFPALFFPPPLLTSSFLLPYCLPPFFLAFFLSSSWFFWTVFLNENVPGVSPKLTDGAPALSPRTSCPVGARRCRAPKSSVSLIESCPSGAKQAHSSPTKEKTYTFHPPLLSLPTTVAFFFFQSQTSHVSPATSPSSLPV